MKRNCVAITARQNYRVNRAMGAVLIRLAEEKELASTLVHAPLSAGDLQREAP